METERKNSLRAERIARGEPAETPQLKQYKYSSTNTSLESLHDVQLKASGGKASPQQRSQSVVGGPHVPALDLSQGLEGGLYLPEKQDQVNLGEVVLEDGKVMGSIRREDSRYLDDYIDESDM